MTLMTLLLLVIALIAVIKWEEQSKWFRRVVRGYWTLLRLFTLAIAFVLVLLGVLSFK